VKQAPFMVLHKAYMPRVLVEMGFISNYVEGNLLDSESGQNEIATAIANAIISYKMNITEQ
jgi:N-acetylmuramoyl-L-alanine amidase